MGRAWELFCLWVTVMAQGTLRWILLFLRSINGYLKPTASSLGGRIEPINPIWSLGFTGLLSLIAGVWQQRLTVVIICVILVILEQFKNSMPDHITTSISKLKFKMATEAAALADDYKVGAPGQFPVEVCQPEFPAPCIVFLCLNPSVRTLQRALHTTH